PRQPRASAAASSGIVSSHEQIRIFPGRSAMSCRWSLLRPRGRHWPRRPSSYNDCKQQSLRPGAEMPPPGRTRLRTSSKPALDLPPPFRLVALREVGDAFAHAVAVAGEEGAGTLVHVGRFDLAEFAVVLEPEEPLRTARRALYAGLVALADALAVHA